VVSGAHHVTVDADLVAKTYSVSVDGVLVQAGVPFEDAVGLDTVRLLTDGLNETNFTGRCFDNVDLQAAASFGVAPQITSTAIATGTTWLDYAYDVQATGSPNPTFSLVTAPAGMTINATTGLISWMPSASGNYPVTVQASNQHGSDTQSFTLSITNGPIFPCALAPIEIMPLGDSITKGFGTCSAPDTDLNCTGYRDDLWYSLTDNGYLIDLVGSEGEEFQYLHDYDNNHEGHGGWSANQIRDNIYGSGANWLQTNPADVILLHIGTNDISAGQAPNGIVTEVSQILDRIDQFEGANNRDVMVILARIINRSDPGSAQGLATTNFNNLLQSMANNRIAAGDRLIIVNMESALNYPADMVDSTHPNGTGYTKMFNVWNNALSPLLPNCLSAADIYSFPVTSASVGQPYQYNVGARGYPLPSFGLNTAPSGMSINASTGLIQWTPGASGSVPVAVQAANSQGTDTQNFVINVGGSAACLAGTVSYWKLDENSGTTFSDYFNGNPATFAGTGGPVFTSGKVNGALDFNGTDHRLSTSAVGTPTNGITVMAWINPDSIGTLDRGIVSKKDAFILEIESTGAKLSFSILNGAVLREFEPDVFPGNDLQTGAWTHVAATFDGTTTTLYINGMAVGSETSTLSALGNSNEPYYIGWTAQTNLATDRYFDGRIDEVAVFSRALSATEIQQLYNNTGMGAGYC
jgi:hypothetical protein